MHWEAGVGAGARGHIQAYIFLEELLFRLPCNVTTPGITKLQQVEGTHMLSVTDWWNRLM